MNHFNTLLFVAALALGASSCAEELARDNPLDPAGVRWGEADAALAGSWEGDRVVLSWRRVDAVEVRAYRLYRRDARASDAPTGVVAEVAQPEDGPAVSWEDATPPRDGVAFYRLALVTPWGDADGGAEIEVRRPGACDPACAGDSLCRDGVCVAVPCGAGGACPEGTVCNRRTFAGRCVVAGAGGDGEVCVDDLDCATSWCGDDGLCGGRHAACAGDGPCPVGLVCAGAFGVCTDGCPTGGCPADEACVGGFCLPACAADAACDDGARCVAPSLQPVNGGGCGEVALCGACPSGQRCVAGPGGAFACCADADGDGRFSRACPWGTDCDDDNAAVWDQCDVCMTGQDCFGGQCVLLDSGVGLCGGPAGCHCPVGAACASGENPPRCVAAGACLEDLDCQLAHTGQWRCEVVSSLGPALRCVCDDPSVCPRCVLDAECLVGQICVEGRCELP